MSVQCLMETPGSSSRHAAVHSAIKHLMDPAKACTLFMCQQKFCRIS